MIISVYLRSGLSMFARMGSTYTHEDTETHKAHQIHTTDRSSDFFFFFLKIEMIIIIIISQSMRPGPGEKLKLGP